MGRWGTRGSVVGLLRVYCWCHSQIVGVSPERLKAGMTGSCGRPGCHPPKL